MLSAATKKLFPGVKAGSELLWDGNAGIATILAALLWGWKAGLEISGIDQHSRLLAVPFVGARLHDSSSLSALAFSTMHDQ